ncbi:hypothetical protein K0M31_017845 [Melipona bicolor]|uniref:Uncharacterized protein n=1 Tax=Melipona bicolor TaxID=60889 RepID=A0AA40G619_9HYME|nr:hypothetical protein K0M31_017845 [Melipona bicolor]
MTHQGLAGGYGDDDGGYQPPSRATPLTMHRAPPPVGSKHTVPRKMTSGGSVKRDGGMDCVRWGATASGILSCEQRRRSGKKVVDSVG